MQKKGAVLLHYTCLFVSLQSRKHNIMRRFFSLLLLLSYLPLAAQQTYRARVVDAESGEAVPCVRVTPASSAETYTNLEGGFSLGTKGDVLRLTKEGYETMEVTVADTEKQNIRMQPLIYTPTSMTEEEVERMVYKMAFRMHQAYKKDKAAKPFCYRSLIHSQGRSYLSEGIIRALSANNLRRMDYVSRTFYNEVEEETSGEEPLYLHRTNINDVLQLGPMMQVAPNWKWQERPFIIIDRTPNIRKRYALTCETRQDGDGKTMYRVRMQPRKAPVKRPPDKPGMETILMPAPTYLMAESYPGKIAGTLYLDAKHRPTAFEGDVEELQILTHEGWVPATCHVSIVYSTRGGRTMVEHISGTLAYGDTSSHAMMSHLDKAKAGDEEDWPKLFPRTALEQAAADAYQNKE